MSAAPAGSATSKPAAPDPLLVRKARSAANTIAQALGTSTVVELDVAADLNTPIPAGLPPEAGQANLVHQIHAPGGGQGWNQVSTPNVATPAVLKLYGIKAADISSGASVITARHDLAGVELGTGVGRDFTPVTVQVLPKLPLYSSAPNALLTPRAMAAAGLTAEPVGWLVQARQALTPTQLVAARHRAAAAGVTIESRTGPDQSLQQLRDYSTLAGALVALGVLAMTVGLIRGETAGDLRTLAATGASGSTRRTLNATSAGALALLGGILGTAAAYLALIAWHWHDVSYLNQPPYANLAVLVFGLPAAAVAGAWLLGRTPKSLGRRQID